MAQRIARRYWALVAAVAGLIGAGAGGATQAQGIDCDGCPPSSGSGPRVEFFTDSITPTDQAFGGQQIYDLGTLQPVERFFPPSPCRGKNFFEGKLFPPGAIRANQSFAQGRLYPPSPCNPGEYLFDGHFIDGRPVPSGSVELVGKETNPEQSTGTTDTQSPAG